MPMTKEQYLEIFKAFLKHSDLLDAFNDGGFAGATVCPECHVDDFFHVEDCSLQVACLEIETSL